MPTNCRYGCKGCKRITPEIPASKVIATIGIVYSVRPSCHTEVYQGPFQSGSPQKPEIPSFFKGLGG